MLGPSVDLARHLTKLPDLVSQGRTPVPLQLRGAAQHHIHVAPQLGNLLTQVLLVPEQTSYFGQRSLAFAPEHRYA